MSSDLRRPDELIILIYSMATRVAPSLKENHFVAGDIPTKGSEAKRGGSFAASFHTHSSSVHYHTTLITDFE